MIDQFEKYARKLAAAGGAPAGGIAFAAKDDVLLSWGEEGLAGVAFDVLRHLNALALIAAAPAVPFPDLLIRRAGEERALLPRDTETRTFLHDIPFLRKAELDDRTPEKIAGLLASRKGVIVEGLGIFATGLLTVEQAFVNYSSVFHASFVKYFQDILTDGFLLPGEEELFEEAAAPWLAPVDATGLEFAAGPPANTEEILAEMARVGRHTVDRGLVDSFFGNISCRSGDLVYISQTASSLDELEGCIDPVPFDNSSTTGITASSELLAHRKIYEATDFSTILHGHPKVAVVMSMLCERKDCGVTDCWKDCREVRDLEGTPVVSGEIGAGGIARSVPPAIAGGGAALVYGHGIFTAGATGFREPFLKMVAVENACRAAYRKALARRVRPSGGSSTGTP